MMDPLSPLGRSPELMNRQETVLLVVDLQERLLSTHPHAARTVWNARRLVDGATALDVPILATEQVPEKLGPTSAVLAEKIGTPIAKTAFSAAPSVLDSLQGGQVRHVLLVGIETHVCIAQTALDLIAEGFLPKIAVDAVGSRFAQDHEVALRRLEASDVGLTSTEAALFEWCETADDPAFRTISALAKETCG